MPELPAVSPGEVIASQHINDIAERTLQRYSDQATLDLQNPTPQAGELAWLDDVAALQMYDGAVWASWFAGGGVRSVQITSSVLAGPRNAQGQPLIRTVAAGTAAAPTYTFHQGTDVGAFLVAGVAYGISTGGVEQFRVGSTGVIRSLATYNNTTGTASDMRVAANGDFQRQTSARRYKSRIRYAN